MKNNIKNFVKNIPCSITIYKCILKFILDFKFLVKKTKRLLFDDIIYVYTMAKVGTSSISRNMNKNFLHIHYFSKKKHEDVFINHNSSIKKKSTTNFSTLIYSFFFKLRKRKVITMFRDPYPRNVSLMFQVLSELIKKRGMNPNNQKFGDFKGVLDFYFENYVRHNHPFVWFDEELKVITGINVFDYSFDKEKGYVLIKKGNIEILLMTLEKLNDNEQIIRDFIDDPNFVLTHQNDGSKKWYSDLYSDFKKRHFLNQEEIDFYYNNDIVRHFYNEETIESFKRKWSKQDE